MQCPRCHSDDRAGRRSNRAAERDPLLSDVVTPVCGVVPILRYAESVADLQAAMGQDHLALTSHSSKEKDIMSETLFGGLPLQFGLFIGWSGIRCRPVTSSSSVCRC